MLFYSTQKYEALSMNDNTQIGYNYRPCFSHFKDYSSGVHNLAVVSREGEDELTKKYRRDSNAP